MKYYYHKYAALLLHWLGFYAAAYYHVACKLRTTRGFKETLQRSKEAA